VAAPLAHGTGDSSWRQAGAIEPDKFDLSGFPARPRDFEEQRILDAIESARLPGAASSTKASAHERLSRWYANRGDEERAQAEAKRARFWSDRLR
ncbi:MAG: hypothetical protein HYZ57_11750, partial [Acidobacteria bacterium]|nr:hypothetical protein [Acidobacteriota bacterium]MBI3280504.1 hypothetical protein [Acidobacteriota bacterium]